MIESTLRFDDVEDIPGLLPLLWAVQMSCMQSREWSGRRPGNEASVHVHVCTHGNHWLPHALLHMYAQTSRRDTWRKTYLLCSLDISNVLRRNVDVLLFGLLCTKDNQIMSHNTQTVQNGLCQRIRVHTVRERGPEWALVTYLSLPPLPPACSLPPPVASDPVSLAACCTTQDIV